QTFHLAVERNNGGVQNIRSDDCDGLGGNLLVEERRIGKISRARDLNLSRHQHFVCGWSRTERREFHLNAARGQQAFLVDDDADVVLTRPWRLKSNLK